MANWIQAIYDRTSADITSRTAKSFWNVIDWLRVTNNTHIAHELIKALMGVDSYQYVLTQPGITTIPTVEEINNLVANIEAVRVASSLGPEVGMSILKRDYAAGFGAISPDYQAVNAWERNLELVMLLAVQAANNYLYCGVSECADNRFWLIRRPWDGWVKDVNDKRRYFRTSFSLGISITRGNRWRSSVNYHRRMLITGIAPLGASLTRQSLFRRYTR